MAISEEEALKIARQAVALYAAGHPLPATVTMLEAAGILGVSERTVRRLKPPRAAGARIPYSWVLERLASR